MNLTKVISTILLSSTVLQSVSVPYAFAGSDDDKGLKTRTAPVKTVTTGDDSVQFLRELSTNSIASTFHLTIGDIRYPKDELGAVLREYAPATFALLGLYPDLRSELSQFITPSKEETSPPTETSSAVFKDSHSKPQISPQVPEETTPAPKITTQAEPPKPTVESVLTKLQDIYAQRNSPNRHKLFAEVGLALTDFKDDQRAQAQVLILILTGLWKPEGKFKLPGKKQARPFLQVYLEQALRTVFQDQFKHGVEQFVDTYAEQALTAAKADPRVETLSIIPAANQSQQEFMYQIERVLYGVYREQPLAAKSDGFHRDFIKRYADNPDVLMAYGLMLTGLPLAEILDVEKYARTPDQMFRGYEVLLSLLQKHHAPGLYDLLNRFVNLRNSESFFDKFDTINGIKKVICSLLNNTEIAETAAQNGSLDAEFQLNRLQMQGPGTAPAVASLEALAQEGHLESILFLYKNKFTTGAVALTQLTIDRLQELLEQSLKYTTAHILRREVYQTLMEIQLRKIVSAESAHEIELNLTQMKKYLDQFIEHYKNSSVLELANYFSLTFRDLEIAFKNMNLDIQDERSKAYHRFLFHGQWAIYNLAVDLKKRVFPDDVWGQNNKEGIVHLFTLAQHFPLARYHMAETLIERSLGQPGFYSKMMDLLEPILRAKIEDYIEPDNNDQKEIFLKIQKMATELHNFVVSWQDVLDENVQRKYNEASSGKSLTRFEMSLLEKATRESQSSPERSQKFKEAFDDYFSKGEGTAEYIRALVLYHMGEIHGDINFIRKMEKVTRDYIFKTLATHGSIVKRLNRVDADRHALLEKAFQTKDPKKRQTHINQVRTLLQSVMDEAYRFIEVHALSIDYQYLQGAWLIEHHMDELSQAYVESGFDPATPPSALKLENQNRFARIYGAIGEGIKSIRSVIAAGVDEATAFVMTYTLKEKKFPVLDPNSLDEGFKRFQTMDPEALRWYSEAGALTKENVERLLKSDNSDFIGGFAGYVLTRSEYRPLLGDNPEDEIVKLLKETAGKGSLKALETLVENYDNSIIKARISADEVRALRDGFLKIPGIQDLPSLTLVSIKAQLLDNNKLSDEDIRIIGKNFDGVMKRFTEIIASGSLAEKARYYQKLLTLVETLVDTTDQTEPQENSGEAKLKKIHSRLIWQMIQEVGQIFASELMYLEDDFQEHLTIDFTQESHKRRSQLRYARELLEIVCFGKAQNPIANLYLARIKRLRLDGSDVIDLDASEVEYSKAKKNQYTYNPFNDTEANMRKKFLEMASKEYTQFKILYDGEGYN